MVRRGRYCDRAGLMPLRCLIVDDNASFREEMRGLLAEQGLDVVGGAGSAAEAFRQIAEKVTAATLIWRCPVPSGRWRMWAQRLPRSNNVRTLLRPRAF